MMKLIFKNKIASVLTALLLVFAGAMNGQVIITPQLPAMGLYLKNQLWNASVLNNGADPKTVRLKIQFSDASTNQLIFTASSKQFVLATGLSLIQYNNVLPVTYNLTNSSYQIDGNPDGFLPIGVFNICYIIMEETGETPQELAEECASVEVEPLSPPQLVFPEHEARILDRRPGFTWLAPSPGGLISNLNYRLVLVEVLPTQSSSDAIQQNVPIISQQNITANSFNFPAAYPQLDTGKNYAWQVIAATNTSEVSKSEVWAFKVQYSYADSSIKTGGTVYAAMNRHQEGAYILSYEKLHFQYTNEINDSTVTLKWYDISSANKQLTLLAEETQPLIFGVNYITKNTGSLPGIKNKELYLLELINSKKESLFLKFEFRR
jgi:hypothetical protein